MSVVAVRRKRRNRSVCGQSDLLKTDKICRLHFQGLVIEWYPFGKQTFKKLKKISDLRQQLLLLVFFPGSRNIFENRQASDMINLYRFRVYSDTRATFSSKVGFSRRL